MSVTVTTRPSRHNVVNPDSQLNLLQDKRGLIRLNNSAMPTNMNTLHMQVVTSKVKTGPTTPRPNEIYMQHQNATRHRHGLQGVKKRKRSSRKTSLVASGNEDCAPT